MKEQIIKRVKYAVLIGVSIVLLSALIVRVKAQDNQEAPVKEYVSPEEMVSLSKDMKFDEAVDVLNGFAQKYDNKVIIDRTKNTSEIGITINKIYWKTALKYIAEVQGLVVDESPRFIEIKKPMQGTAPGEQQSAPVQSNQETPLNFGSREVRIRAIFFEGDKSVMNELGIDWSTIHNIAIRPDNLSQVIDPGLAGSSGNGGGGAIRQTLPDLNFSNEYVEINSRAAQEVTQNLFNGVINFGEIGHTGISIRSLFKAFAANNLGKILATPEIEVRDGQEGRIQVGQDFSIKQRDFAGNVTDRFFSVGTILKVTPHIIDDGDSTFIDMVINAERSTAQPNQVSTIVNKEQATSDIILLDGESTVIAGLYRTQNTNIRKGIPFLKDLPPWFFGLRYLFGYNATQKEEQELIILIKATLEPSLAERNKARIKSAQELLQDQRSKIQKAGEEYKKFMKDGDDNKGMKGKQGVKK